MNAAVLDQLGQGQPGGFAADVVEGADDDDAGRVVDDDVHAGRLLEGADVAPFAADDAALHVVAGDVHRADGGVGGVFGGVALDGGGEDFAGFLLASGLEPFLVFLNAIGDLLAQVFFQSFQKRVLGLFAAQAADFMQFLHLLLDDRFEFFLAFFELFAALGVLFLGVIDGPFFLGQFTLILVEGVFALFEAALLLAQLAAGLFHFLSEVVAFLK